MENAPLTLAHSHARNASYDGYNKPNSSAAVTEHELAAGEFSKAAALTQDTEALRILRLLEDHHLQLSRALKSRSRAAATLAAPDDDRASQASATTVVPSPVSPVRTPRRHPPRDLGSSSIASNLASARGIPGAHQRRGAPLSPTVTAHNVSRERQQRQISPSSAVEATRRQLRTDNDSSVPRPVVTLPSQPEEPEKAAQSPRSPNEAGFHRFYSNFEGLLSTLTAPLVFAGFPLNPSANTSENPQEEDAPPQRQRPKRTAPPPATTTSPTDPDQLNSLISRAAIRALKDTRGLPAAESFYVVPTSGGTVSYAGILSRDPNSAQPGSGSMERPRSRHSINTSINEEFVDASENPQPPSPTASRTSRDGNVHSSDRTSNPPSHRETSKRFATPSAGGKITRAKTLEELELETQKQRETIDLLSKRLVMWETSSQRSAMALAESMRSTRSTHHTSTPRQRPSTLSRGDSNLSSGGAAANDIPPVPPLPGAGTKDLLPEGMDMQELKELLEKERRDRERLSKENEKLVSVLGRYREKWEELKAGAKARVAAREKAAKERNGGQSGTDTPGEEKEGLA